MNATSLSMTIDDINQAYRQGLTPEALIEEVYRRIAQVADDGIFILLRDKKSVCTEASQLDKADFQTEGQPLWGIPFVIKDNIDAQGLATTAGCAAWSYVAEQDAFAVAALRRAGALLIGKTNLDQFATGLVGVRSFHPPPLNAIDNSLVPGGSSSGSAVAVAHGLVSFSLGTDTAGSGRVPAALNNIVGLKPTLGTVSASGVVPACRSLDTISVFALTVSDAFAAYQVIASFDAADAWAVESNVASSLKHAKPFKVAIPDENSIVFEGDDIQRAAFNQSVEALKAAGADVQQVDFEPFYEVARMLYEGAWVTERFCVLEELLDTNPEAVYPVTRQIVEAGRSLSAADAFRGIYRLKELVRKVEPILEQVDYLCVPTIPAPVSLEQINADPVTPNSMLGTYTNFVNLLNLCAMAMPTGARQDGLPASMTLIGKAGKDADIAALALAIEADIPRKLGATDNDLQPVPVASTEALPDHVTLAVCGAHMTGLPLNYQLTDIGATLLQQTHTAPAYALYALTNSSVAKPGMLRVADAGSSVPLEVWSVPRDQFGSFILNVGSPLSIGTVELIDGSSVHGFLVEASAVESAKKIDAAAGWRVYVGSS
jgi:allophanate hydrolase